MMDKTCPKQVEFYSKSKFEKLVHLVCLYYKNLLKSRVLPRRQLDTINFYLTYVLFLLDCVMRTSQMYF